MSDRTWTHDRTHSDRCWRWHIDCAVEHGRADERAKIAAEYRSIAGNPGVLADWRDAHGLGELYPTTSIAAVLSAVAGDIASRLGGYTGGVTVNQLTGADPGHTGGACSTCYIADQRGASPDELEHDECRRALTGGDDG